MSYMLEELCKDYSQGKNIDFLFFWGHRESKDGKITKSCFSQWWKVRSIVDDVPYNCMEQYMMAEKARTFNDTEILDEIMQTKEPMAVKKLGRKIKNFDSKIWDEVKYDIVVKGNYNKFNQNDNLKKFLLSTEDKVLVEASPYDNIWGIGMSASFSDVNNPTKWKGSNLLGFALVEVRQMIREKL